MSKQAAIMDMIEPKLQVDGFLRKNKSRFERKQPDSDFVCFLEFETNTIRGVDRTDAHFGVQWAQFSKIAYEMYKSGSILLPDLKDDMSCIIKGPKQLRLWHQEKTGIFKFQKLRLSREVDDIETYCGELVEIFKGCALSFFDEWSSLPRVIKFLVENPEEALQSRVYLIPIAMAANGDREMARQFLKREMTKPGYSSKELHRHCIDWLYSKFGPGPNQ